MSTIVNITLNAEQCERLQRLARDLDQTPDAAAAALVEEGLRLREFPGIEFRDTVTGRRAFVPGTRIPVYFLAQLAREVDDDVETIAEHYAIHPSAVTVSLDYIRAHPAEIEHEIAEHDAAEERLLASLPPERVVIIP